MNRENSTPSRRQMVSMGTGILAAPVLMVISDRALASEQKPGADSASAAEAMALQNPLTEYPRPPFKKQQQEPPGLACKMDPRPDHGEKSYKGSGKLIGRER